MEIAVFRAIWNQARAWGYTEKTSPTQNIKTHTLTGRKDVYIDDYLYKFVYDHADTDMRDLMDIAYITGQRPIDIVHMHSHHIHDGVLYITQQKTQVKLRFEVTGDLAEIINRRAKGGYLFTSSHGKPLTRSTLSARFNRLRKKLAEKYPEMAIELNNFQFRDLRAKAGTDIYLSQDAEAAKNQLGHASPEMTKRYIRQGKVLKPLSRK
ncbi:integrase [Neisseria sp. N177_16]|nr:integrase [Neisseria sp. N177_16]